MFDFHTLSKLMEEIEEELKLARGLPLGKDISDLYFHNGYCKALEEVIYLLESKQKETESSTENVRADQKINTRLKELVETEIVSHLRGLTFTLDERGRVSLSTEKTRSTNPKNEKDT